LEVFADPQTLARAVAGWMLRLAIAKNGAFAIALSGGSTPRMLYQCLAEPPFRDAFPWSKTHLFWGDERFVPRTDSRSNYGMARDTLLAAVPIPGQNVHPIPAEGTNVEAAAVTYERELMIFHGSERLTIDRPLFDITLLGLGVDGHIASLFPDSAVLDERSRWVAPVVGAEPEARITLTLPALESSRHLAFLVEGASKRAIIERLCEGDSNPPSARLHPVGEEVWFLDQSAAGPAITTGSASLRPRATPSTLHSAPRR